MLNKIQSILDEYDLKIKSGSVFNMRHWFKQSLEQVRKQTVTDTLEEMKNFPTGLFDSTPYMKGFIKETKAKLLKE